MGEAALGFSDLPASWNLKWPVSANNYGHTAHQIACRQAAIRV